MLIISRKKDQKILVADEIEITILDVGRNKVRFGVKAPKHMRPGADPDPGPPGPWPGVRPKFFMYIIYFFVYIFMYFLNYEFVDVYT